MIHIQGYYESGEDEYSYDIYLRPWGTYWDDVEEEDLPAFYDDWYLPLIVAGEAMPDSIGTGAPCGRQHQCSDGNYPRRGRHRHRRTGANGVRLHERGR